jgi:hypothetical protein
MVIRTEYRGTRYSMGSSDPLPVGFEIRFGGLNFQATGNGYLMRLSNREELRARRQAGSVPAATTHAITTQMPTGTDAAGPSAPRRRRRSGRRSRQARSERRQAERAASQHGAPVSAATTALVGQCTVSGPRFPTVCAVPRRPTTPASTPRCAGFPLAVTSSSPGPWRLRWRRIVPGLHCRVATRQLAWVRRMGLLRRTGPSDVQAFS